MPLPTASSGITLTNLVYLLKNSFTFTSVVHCSLHSIVLWYLTQLKMNWWLPTKHNVMMPSIFFNSFITALETTLLPTQNQWTEFFLVEATIGIICYIPVEWFSKFLLNRKLQQTLEEVYDFLSKVFTFPRNYDSLWHFLPSSKLFFFLFRVTLWSFTAETGWSLSWFSLLFNLHSLHSYWKFPHIFIVLKYISQPLFPSSISDSWTLTFWGFSHLSFTQLNFL